MDLLFGLLFLEAVAYGIWYWVVRKGKNRGIPLGEKPVSTAPGPEPLNSDIMRKLENIEKSIDGIEVQTKKVEKSVKDMYGWLWALWIGWMLGLFWDDIVNIFKSLFLVGQ